MLDLRQKAILQSESGVALLLTIMLMVVFSLLSVSLFEMLKASTQISGNHRWDLELTYVADAGVEDAINRLRMNPDSPADGSSYSFSETFAGATYNVTVTDDGTPTNAAIYDHKYIGSIATSGGFSRTVNAHVNIIKVFGSDPPAFIVITTSWELQ